MSYPIISVSHPLGSLSLKELNLRELYNLSFLSQDFKEQVSKFTKLHRKLRMEVNSGFIKVGTVDYSWNPVFWRFKDPRILETMEDQKPIYQEMNGVVLKFYEDPECPLELTCYTEYPEMEMMVVLRYLKETFNCKLKNLFIPLQEVEDLDVYLQDPYLHSCETLEVSEGAVSHLEMTRLLEQFPNAEKKHLRCYPGRDFVYDKPLSVPHLHLTHSSWVTPQNLRNFDCASIRLENCLLTEKAFNDFIVNWLVSDNNKLEYLCARGKLRDAKENDDGNMGFEDLKISNILRGIPMKLHSKNENLTNSYSPYHTAIFFSGFDIFRESDGVKATAMVLDWMEDCDAVQFVFTVWK